ncbi:hypothetical protein PENSPDRAFT_44985 [Peniophora sp. CONT]|nr:hypothetical protein PENSPDRAFT_44985 [Peniophora sp. CONT]
MDQAKSKEAGNRILRTITENPRHATERFRELFEMQQSSPVALEHYGSPDITVDQLMVSLHLWANVACHMFTKFEEVESLFRLERHVDIFAEPGGLLDLYQDMVMWQGLLSDLALFHLVVVGLAMGIQALRSKSTLPCIRSRASEVWAHIWQWKADFTRQSLESATDLGDKETVMMHPTIMLLQAYQRYYDSINTAPSVTSHNPHLVLYVWASYDGRRT